MGWTGWIRLGGYVLGNPAVIYDLENSTLQVYTVGSNHALYEIWWGGLGPVKVWSPWISLGGYVLGNPAVGYDLLTNNIEVYALARNDSLVEQAHSAGSPGGGGWSGFIHLGGTLTSDPAVAFDDRSGNFEVYATALNHSLVELAFTGHRWVGWIHLGGYILGNPAVTCDKFSTNFEIYAAAANHSLVEKAWTA